MSWYATKKASKLSCMDKSRIVVFDVETTGLYSTVDEIIQICILNGYGNVLFSSYIKPVRHKVWTEAQRVNGIRYSMVKEAPIFKEVKEKIQEIFNNAELLVGYNINFDIDFLESAGIIVVGPRFDVMTAFASYRADIEHSFYRRCKLIECAEYFGYSFKAHDSSEDAKATLHCFNALITDKRFTTYKRSEKKQLQDKIPIEKKKTKMTVAFKGGQSRIILLGLLLFVIGILLLSKISNIMPKDANTAKMLFLFIRNNYRTDPRIFICSVAVVVGVIMVFLKLLRIIINLPKRIVVYTKRLFKRL